MIYCKQVKLNENKLVKTHKPLKERGKIIKKKVLSFVVVPSMLSALVLVPLPSSAATSGDYTYTVNDDGTATITKYTGNDVEVTIPERIDGYTVTVISSLAFRNNQATQKIVLPNTIKKIQNMIKAPHHCDAFRLFPPFESEGQNQS